MNDFERIRELNSQGFYCSQILVQMGLDLQGKENPDLVASAEALAGGIGFSGFLCGALSGGASMIGLYAGRGEVTQEQDGRLTLMLLDLTEWFTRKYGYTECDQLIEGDRNNIPLRCPEMVAAVYQKVKELLVEYGYELSGASN